MPVEKPLEIINSRERVAEAVGATLPELLKVVNNWRSYHRVYNLIDPSLPTKARTVVSPLQPLRRYQRCLLDNYLVPLLVRSKQSHGGVPGRNTLSNALVHIESAFVLTADISNFFPSIHFSRVQKLFEKAGHRLEVAILLTKICTYEHRLSQGLITSPLLADASLRTVDERIAGMCLKAGLKYSRFIDDITLSGPFNFDCGGIQASVEKILRDAGFQANQSKWKSRNLSLGSTVTGLRVKRGSVGIPSEYYNRVLCILLEMERVSTGGELSGHYFHKCQLAGKISYIRQISPRMARPLVKVFNRIDWAKVHSNAITIGLVQRKKRLVPT